MSPEAIETMVSQQKQQTQEPIFRSIVEGKIPSNKIDENADCIAVLDIKPISKGHTVIIPKKAVTKAYDLPDSTMILAKELSKHICSVLKAEGTEIQTQFAFGEIVINIIPVYDKPVSINSQREEPKKEELDEIYFKLKKEKKVEVIKKKTVKKEKVYKIGQRLP